MEPSSSGRRLIPILAALFVLAWPVAAREARVETILSAFRVVAAQDGGEELLPADRAKPGEVIEYALVCKNTGDEPVDDLQPTLPIPPGTEYLPGTAIPAEILASLDGKTFAPVPLMRTVKTADGGEREEEVPYREYRFIRWRLGRLEPNQETVTRIRVRIAAGDNG